MNISTDTQRPSTREGIVLGLMAAGWAGVTAGCYLLWGAGVASMVGGTLLLIAGVVSDWRG